MKLYTCMDALLGEMEDFVCERYGCDSASWRTGDFAAGALMEFKARHGDGRLDHWTVADVRAFLLDWFPRTVQADACILQDVPECAAVFFHFMDLRGSLSGDALAELEATCLNLHDEFLASCADRTLWQPSKATINRILAPAPADAYDARPARRSSVGHSRRRSLRALRTARR